MATSEVSIPEQSNTNVIQRDVERTRSPLPGDGAFLSKPQPGAGQYLSSGGRAGRSRGNTRGGTSSRGNRHSSKVSTHEYNAPQQSAGPSLTHKPVRPSSPRKLESSDPILNQISTRGVGRGRGKAAPRGDRESNDTRTGPSGKLDPHAISFVPSQPSDHPSSSRSGSASITQSDGEGVRKSSKNKSKARNKSVPNSPKPSVSSRRAAFLDQAKLTTSSNTASEQGEQEEVGSRSGKTPITKKQQGGKKGKQDEKDDWISKLTRGLRSRPFIECPICFNGITPGQPIWACTPPTQSPRQKIQEEDADEDPNYYLACYTPFHLTCIRDWANRSLIEEKERNLNFGKEHEEVSWRCPGCQKRRSERVGGYRCFCGRLSSPPTNTAAPHSCGDSCSRKRHGCDHPCPLPCHPGPCPPCQVALVVPCPSHHTALTVKCAVATSNNAALSPVCDEICDRNRDCGEREHSCEQLCHHGPCMPCAEVETVSCYCGHESKEVNCGWHRKDAKQCAKAGEEGKEDQHWEGRYSCNQPCKRKYNCDIHPCPEKCHPHPVHALTCPFDPSLITTCPCGTTPLSELPAPPRPDCLAPVPTCQNKCPRSRPCGHQCPLTCHSGECPPCHEEVVRPCRCGESMLVVPCDELREKMAAGEDVTCDRLCKALRNCGRHQCGRTCCPLSWQAKTKKKKGLDEIDLMLNVIDADLHECQLTCGKLLSCGLHTCQKKDHRGSCGRCLEASYDELICHCGRTIIYPPVACGTTINCPYPCARDPPACGHPRTAHPCHEQPQCPPCPFLTTKACACGKDPAVKNVRCSQEKVSCGQECGELLSCGYHRCNTKCHRPGECESCTQVCGKPKRICRHPCTAVCHAPAKCPENDPCQAIITQSCSCGHLQSRTSCGASHSNPSSRESVVLKCNSECAVRQRNARLADALGIQPKERATEEWHSDMKSFASANHAFVKMVENTIADFFKGTRQTLVLPYMPLAKRNFVMSLADSYRLGRELIDQEPNRSVQIRRRVDTRIPTPLLSAAATPPAPKPAFGNLTNLRTARTNVWAPASSGSTSSAADPSSGKNTGGINNQLQDLSISNKAAHPTRSGATTPMPGVPVIQEIESKVGQVDDDDWDQ